MEAPGFDPAADAERRLMDMMLADHAREKEIFGALNNRLKAVNSQNYICTLFQPHTCTSLTERRKLR
eukprot:2705191-Pleurochrysis_carterae.AAC.1